MAKNYVIDYAKNMITVTKKFHEAAGQIGTDEYSIMAELRKLGMPISVKAPAKKKVAPAEDKPVEETAGTTAEAPAEAPVQEAKPRTRKPRAKKQEAVSEVSAEDGQGQAE